MTGGAAPDAVPGLVEHLFREQAGRLVARLTRILGADKLDLAEDVVQDALLAALRTWPFAGLPENPAAWLAEVARNRALDVLRRGARMRGKLAAIHAWAEEDRRAQLTDPRFADELDDDRLRLMFTCCHPAIGCEARAALTLKAAAGFGVAEIARAFLTRTTTIAQRIVRAKKQIRDENVRFEVPGPRELPERLDGVLEVLYLMFNEGYGAHRGESLVRPELVEEAIRLTRIVAEHPVTAAPRVHALLALMLLQGARLPARVSPDGRLVLLAEQDRARWDAAMTAAGFTSLAAAGRGDDLSPYHLEAAIAACHMSASDASTTDWPQVLFYYDLLAARFPTPVIALNRAVAVAMAHGDDAGLREIEKLEKRRELRDYYLLPAAKAELLRRLGRTLDAHTAYDRALAMSCTDPEREFLRTRRAMCRGGGGP